ncbi:IclR family transcriptional regulator [Caldisalinibacter kiritimatiensis]|uniref:Transcriptional regulator KdgR, KDG operon repressor n=1 Tax=Caldisalinibacter kiritimatiensis TaxID=1304284 RepID=R1CSI2_9FIRM|nr:IclR family transcriptional regulator [Caldisalinibacter kiritimatiensis]EOD01616.1 Transcriptional regulator KdgR, KDG operon repressor [Caldisalinibacter kiritimatiensis]
MSRNQSSIQKTINILKQLARAPYEMTALELSNELSINRSTVHRILNTLKDEMLVLQNPVNKKYTLGPMAYHIGIAYINNQTNSEQIKYILNEVAKETKQSVGYAMLIDGKIMNIYEIENYQPIKIGYRPGSFYPIHCGAYGKCITAFIEPKEKLKKIVYSSELYKKTPNTITDPEELLKEYEKIRKNGYAISNEESLLGAIGIGAPVRNSSGKVIGSVAAASIKSALTNSDFEFIKQKVIEAAQKISKFIP